MADRIRLLPDVVANQIAAGEVVLYPSSVVKEMMENAVDAGAGSVTVNFRDGGKELIQIVDTGCGMSPVDARLAFDRHATSKIRKAEDIYAISTFGFRGEALASIAAVAEVEVRTRQKGDEFGTSVEISGGTFRAQNIVNCPEGTQFLVRNLFYNTPARRRFIESTPKESRRIKEEFRRVALCNPDVSFMLYENDAPIYNLPAANLRQRIVGVMGKNIAGNLLEVNTSTSIAKIEGFVGRPAASKQNNTEHYMFVNGRYFRSPYLQKAILQAYDKLIPPNTKPSYFIYLTIDPERVDVNVHPQKTEVKFEDEAALFQIVNAAVRESLGKLGARPMMDFDMDTSIDIPVHRSGVAYKSPDIAPNPDFNPFNDLARDIAPMEKYGIKGDYIDLGSALSGDTEQKYDFYDAQEEYDRSMIEFIEGEDAQQGILEITATGNFGRPVSISPGYCAATFAGELLVVDVKRAREAVLFDRYVRMAGAHIAVSQRLLFPQEASLSMEECCLVRQYAAELGELGFELSLPDEHTAVITALPADIAGSHAGELLRELTVVMAQDSGSPREMRIRSLAAALASRQSAGLTVADEDSLAQLLSDLAECDQPNLTPSGNQVLFRLTQDEIKRRL